MTNVILLTENELHDKINDAVQDAIQKMETPKIIRRKNLDFREAIEFLFSIGYKCSESQIYKLTMQNLIPFEKFGRRMIFDADSLEKWVNDRKQKSVDVTLNVSKCATSKLLRK